MTEAMLIAIISPISLIVGYILSLFSTMMQNKNKIKELELKYENDRKEKQIERLIKKRTPLLTEIEIQLQNITEYLLAIERLLNFLKNCCYLVEDRIVWNESASHEYLKQIQENYDDISDSRDNIMIYITKINNHDLHSMLSKVDLSCDKLSRNIMTLINIRDEQSEGKMGGISNVNVIEQCDSTLTVTADTLILLREANKKIEELSCGIE
jgi:hypothetical protein